MATPSQPGAGVLEVLGRLDALLQCAVQAAGAAFGPAAAADLYRGLHVSREDVAQLLHRPPCTSTFTLSEDAAALLPLVESAPASRLARLGDSFELDAFEKDVLLISLAPDVDPRYERLYAYLQDDVTRKRPSVDLALNLLCATPALKIARRSHFAADARLVRHGLLHLIADPTQVYPPLLSHFLKVDDQILQVILGERSFDARLARFCQFLTPTLPLVALHLPDDTKKALSRIVLHARQERVRLRLYLQGLTAVEHRAAAEALATLANAPLLVVDPLRLVPHEAEVDVLLRVLLREAFRWGALLFVESFDAQAFLDRPQLFQRLVTALAEFKGILLLSGERPWFPVPISLPGVLPTTLRVPDMPERSACWQAQLQQARINLKSEEVDLLADRFQLSAAQIADVVGTADLRARWRSSDDKAQPPGLQDVIDSVRTVTASDVGGLVQRIEPRRGWGDLKLPPDVTAQLDELCRQVKHRRRVLRDWGFADRLSLGTGISALFAGPPGTGKTTAAEIIARELNLELYVVDLSQLFSKFIGDTPKHIRTLFAAAQRNNAILFCDECDSLYGKRSEVRDSHDRYANIEVSQLLAEMDRYEGCAILATNMRQNMDDAFLRRLQFIVEFPFPDPAQRKEIWEVHFPKKAPRDDKIDFDFLANRLPLAGGNIKNIVLGAAYLAAGNGGTIRMKHLLHMARREYQKIGKVWDVSAPPTLA